MALNSCGQAFIVIPPPLSYSCCLCLLVPYQCVPCCNRDSLSCSSTFIPLISCRSGWPFHSRSFCPLYSSSPSFLRSHSDSFCPSYSSRAAPIPSPVHSSKPLQ